MQGICIVRAQCQTTLKTILGQRQLVQAQIHQATQVVGIRKARVGQQSLLDLVQCNQSLPLIKIGGSQLDAQAGAPLLEAWKDLPIRFVGGVQVAGVEKIDGKVRLTTACGRKFAADQVIAAAGLATPPRLAHSAALAWDNGIAVEPVGLRTSVERIHALGDCITVDGQASRYIEPIARQARTIAAQICAAEPEPYQVRPMVVRVKTTSMPLTLH